MGPRRSQGICRIGTGRCLFPRRSILFAISAISATTPIVMAQPVRRIGILGDTPGPQWDAFRKALAELGYLEGSTVAFESRYSQGHGARFPDLAVELARRGVEVI